MHVVSKDGIVMDPEKIRDIMEWETSWNFTIGGSASQYATGPIL